MNDSFATSEYCYPVGNHCSLFPVNADVMCGDQICDPVLRCRKYSPREIIALGNVFAVNRGLNSSFSPEDR